MRRTSRRTFLGSALAAAAFPLVPFRAPSLRQSDSNRRLRIAQIGCGGKGLSDLQACAKEHDIVALCDVDEGQAQQARAEQPQARFHFDYRDLIDREQLDAVVVSTPDHSHALPALLAMQRGLHVFVQKPLVHTVEEAHLLLAAARRHKVITQMGNQGTSLPGFRAAVEAVRSGAIGKVREVHVWTNRPTGCWRQGIARPDHVDAIPKTLRWDLWLGPAQHRPFAQAKGDFGGYAPFHWRGFWDFGTGALGDMACHVANLPFFALELGAPDWVEAEAQGFTDETAPESATIRFGFPARGERPEVVLHWYDGGRLPPDEVLPAASERAGMRALGHGGFLLVGANGTLFSPTDYGETFALFPRARFAEWQPPAPTLARSPGHHQEWLDGILANAQPMANFEYAAPFTAAMLLGNVAIRSGQRLQWDAAAMRIANAPDAEHLLRKDYRRGFELPRR